MEVLRKALFALLLIGVTMVTGQSRFLDWIEQALKYVQSHCGTTGLFASTAFGIQRPTLMLLDGVCAGTRRSGLEALRVPRGWRVAPAPGPFRRRMSRTAPQNAGCHLRE